MSDPAIPSILDQLYALLLERKKALPKDSYSAALFIKGEDAILKKLGEEACEVILASKSGEKKEIVHEAADLLFHLLMLLGYHDVPPADILEELSRRFESTAKKEEGG